MHKKNKIYVVSEFVDKKTNSTGYYWYKTIKGISRKKNNISVISLSESCDKAVNENNKVSYIPVKNRSRNLGTGFAKKLIENFIVSFLFTLKIAKHAGKNDVVFSGTNPSLIVLFISILKIFKRFKWVVLINDVFPENLVPAKLISKNSFIYKFIISLFNFAYKKADKIIVIGRDMRELIAKKTNNLSDIKYISNWVDLKDISSNKSKAFEDSFEDKVVFQFFVYMGIVQGLDILLESISKTKNKKAKFNFIGNGSGAEDVKQFILHNPHIDISLLPPIPFKHNNEGLSACDIAMVSLTEGMSGLAVPSKAYFSLAADKPIFVIGDKGSELELLINENDFIGWYSSSFNSTEIAESIDKICDLDRSKFINKPRELINIKYNYNDAINEYISVINSLES